MVDWYRTRAFYDHWLVGAAGLNIGLESQVVGIMECVTPPLTEKYGFTNDEIGYFEVHWKTDAMHSMRAYELVSKFAASPELRAECLARVARATEMRWLFTDGIYRTFVSGESLNAKQPRTAVLPVLRIRARLQSSLVRWVIEKAWALLDERR